MTSLFHASAARFPRSTIRESSMLSRVADNFYWMTRYLERAEHAARLLEINLELMPDQVRDATDRWERLLQATRSERVAAGDGEMAQACLRLLAFDTENPNSIASCVTSVRNNALQIRQHISSEMFEHLNALYWRVRRSRMEEVWASEPTDFFRSVQQASHLFAGLTLSTMDHGQEFFFMQLGRYVERATVTARLLDAFFRGSEDDAPSGFEAEDYLRWVGLLKASTAHEAYLRTHHAEIDPRPVAEFLLLDATFPRSMRFCADRIVEALQQIAAATGGRRSEPLERLAGRLQASLQFTYIDEIIAGDIHRYLADVERQCDGLNNAIYHTYISYPVELPE